MACVECKKQFSRDCMTCRQGQRSTPLKLLTQMPWPTHEPIWNEQDERTMSCVRCGIPIRPEMTMRELFSPCSVAAEVR